MVLKKERDYIEGPIPIDESWWEVILEDVEAQFAAEHSTKISDNDHNFEGTRLDSPPSEINWEWVKSAYDKDQVISLKAADYNRGGILVHGEKIQGFVPASHLIENANHSSEEDRNHLLSSYIGKSLSLKIIECDQDKGRIVLSERAAQSNTGRRIELLQNLEIGNCATGKVTTITDFGVFVDLGGVEGLLHISELSWGRVRHPSEIVSVDDEIEICVLQLDLERNRVALSLKRLQPNPWDMVNTQYEIGQVAQAVVTNIVSYGVFARLEDGLDGLIHISELSDIKKDQKLEDIFTEGQEITVNILNIDPSRQRLGLSLATSGEGMT